VLGQPAKETVQRMGFGNRARHNRALLTQLDTKLTNRDMKAAQGL
jgi:hypothetical protein